MKWLLFCFFLLPVLASAVEVRYLASAKLESKMSFNKTTVGGLSDLVKATDGTYWVATDDRGAEGSPRLYQFEIAATKNTLKVTIKDVLAIKDLKTSVVDFEGLSILPWGNFLIVSEGDLNHKPRISPALFDIKKNGAFVREYAIPEAFIPNKSGKQKKGVENNRAFEGLTQSPDGQHWLVATEGSLFQDKGSGFSRWILYDMPEAWVIKAAKQWAYPLEEAETPLKVFKRGVSALLWHQPQKALVLERQVAVDMSQGFGFEVELYEADFAKAEDISKLSSLKNKKFEGIKKTRVARLRDLIPKEMSVQNFEGLAWGPEIPGLGKTLLLMSDDNFKSELSSQFVLLSIKE